MHDEKERKWEMIHDGLLFAFAFPLETGLCAMTVFVAQRVDALHRIHQLKELELHIVYEACIALT